MKTSYSSLRQEINWMISGTQYDNNYKNVSQKRNISSAEKKNSKKFSSITLPNYYIIKKTPNIRADLNNKMDVYTSFHHIKKWTLDQIEEIQNHVHFKTNRYRKRFYLHQINMSSIVSK